jgi:hypothetical protein
MTQFGGGSTPSNSLPLDLEGNAACSRAAPVFPASDGTTQRPVPVKWSSLPATDGVGLNFAPGDHRVVRPIFDGTLGCVASDLASPERDDDLEICCTWIA